LKSGDQWFGERFDFLRLREDSVLKMAANLRYSVARKYAAGKVLEVGCGTGAGASTLPSCELFGVDNDIAACGYARQNYHMMGAVADARKLPFRTAVFDTVLCLEVLEHLAEHEKLLSEVARVMKLGAILVLSTPNPQCLGIENYPVSKFHVAEVPVSDVDCLLSEAFRVVRRASCFVPVNYTPCGQTRVFRQLVQRFPRLVNRVLYVLGRIWRSKARFHIWVAERGG